MGNGEKLIKITSTSLFSVCQIHQLCVERPTTATFVIKTTNIIMVV